MPPRHSLSCRHALASRPKSARAGAAPWLRYDAYGVPPLADRGWALVAHLTPSAAFPLFGADGGTTVGLAALWSVGLLGLAAAGYRSGTPISPATNP